MKTRTEVIREMDELLAQNSELSRMEIEHAKRRLENDSKILTCLQVLKALEIEQEIKDNAS